ncbi:MAG: ImmA/IrrE family metallo-endopeptidase [Candidatus Dojkabacteria bacterium]
MIDKPRIKLSIQKASEIIQELEIKSPPIVLKDILEHLKLIYNLDFNCCGLELSNDFSGFYRNENGLIIIGYNNSHHEHKQRFTVAHEFGHFILDHRIIMGELTQRIRLNSKIKEEVEANAFASELLMPSHLIRKEIIQSKDDILRLANKYKVSKEAMEWRIFDDPFITGYRYDFVDRKQKDIEYLKDEGLIDWIQD